MVLPSDINDHLVVDDQKHRERKFSVGYVPTHTPNILHTVHNFDSPLNSATGCYLLQGLHTARNFAHVTLPDYSTVRHVRNCCAHDPQLCTRHATFCSRPATLGFVYKYGLQRSKRHSSIPDAASVTWPHLADDKPLQPKQGRWQTPVNAITVSKLPIWTVCCGL